MFTIKYRYWVKSRTQPQDGPTCYSYHESINGPFEFISQETDENNCDVVYVHPPGGAPGTQFGPAVMTEVAGEMPPRPTLWVMNEHGATVAKYDL